MPDDIRKEIEQKLEFFLILLFKEYSTPPEQPTPEELLLQRERSVHLQKVMATMPTRQEYILRSYFGFDGQGGLTFSEIGAVLELTPQAVNQVYKRALHNLGKKLIEHSFEYNLRS